MPGPAMHARGGRAVLAGVPEAAELDALGDGVEVGVVEDDHRRLAAELEVHALERVGGGPGHRLAGRTSPVSETIATPGCRDDAGAHRLAVASDHVEHARREDLARRSSASSSVVSGVVSAGLSTTVLPAASAGPSFHAAIISG